METDPANQVVRAKEDAPVIVAPEESVVETQAPSRSSSGAPRDQRVYEAMLARIAQRGFS